MHATLRPSVIFVAATYCVSALAGLALWSCRAGLTPLTLGAAGAIYMLIPMSVAMVLQKFVYRRGLAELGIAWRPNRWFAVAWLFPALLAAAAAMISLALPGITFSAGMEGLIDRLKGAVPPEQLDYLRQSIQSAPLRVLALAALQGMIAGVTINAVFAFGEEYGWRGFLHENLAFLGFWRSSFLIGIIWGFWHAPFILIGHNCPQHPVGGVFVMTLWTVLFSPLIGYVRVKSGSVIAAAIMHGTLNGTAAIPLMVLEGGSDLMAGVMGAAGMSVLAGANVLVFLLSHSAPYCHSGRVGHGAVAQACPHGRP